MHKVLIVDDDPAETMAAAAIVAAEGYAPLIAASGREALAILERTNDIAAMILDLVMPDMDGMAVLEALRRARIAVPVIAAIAPSAPETALSAKRLGAHDFIVKPVTGARLAVSLANALRFTDLQAALRTERARGRARLALSQIVAASPAMTRPIALARKAAASAMPILIEGEPGVGKRLLAQAIHGSGERAGKPFVIADCSTLPAGSMEAFLFGTADAPGKVREAHNGTLLLVAVDALPPHLQEKLLGVIEEGEIMPEGASKPLKVNVRLILATRKRLLNLARAGHVREDLFYRLAVFPIYLPPLRDRKDDIPALLAHLGARISAEEGRACCAITGQARDLLAQYDWPGNVAQLENVLHRAIVLGEGPALGPGDFPLVLAALHGPRTAHEAAIPASFSSPIHIDDARVHPPVTAEPSVPASDRFLHSDGRLRTLADIERELIGFALARNGSAMAQIARELGIGRSTLYRKLKDYGLEPQGALDVA